MIKVKRIAAALAMAAAVLIGVSFAATPASAAFSDCPAGTACIWSGPNGTGTKWVLSYSALGGPFVCNLLGSAWKQDVSYKVDFGGGHGLGVYGPGEPGCNVGILGSWPTGTSGTLLDQNGSAYKKVTNVMIY